MEEIKIYEMLDQISTMLISRTSSITPKRNVRMDVPYLSRRILQRRLVGNEAETLDTLLLLAELTILKVELESRGINGIEAAIRELIKLLLEEGSSDGKYAV